MSFHIFSPSIITPPSPPSAHLRGVSEYSLRLMASHYCQSLMKPAYHYCNIIKIKNKGYNQMKDPTIIRRTMEVRRRDHVRNAHLDYSAKYHDPAINHNHLSYTQGHNYFII